MFVKDFKYLSPTALKNSIGNPEGPLAFPIFIRFIADHASLTSILPTAPSTLLASMLSLHLFSTFINFSICYFQVFFRSYTLTFTASLSSLRQLTPTTSFFSPTLCLAILNNSQPSQHESIAIYTTLLASFFASQYFFLSSSFRQCFQILNNSLFLHTATSTYLFHQHVSKCQGLSLV